MQLAKVNPGAGGAGAMGNVRIGKPDNPINSIASRDTQAKLLRKRIKEIEAASALSPRIRRALWYLGCAVEFLELIEDHREVSPIVFECGRRIGEAMAELAP